MEWNESEKERARNAIHEKLLNDLFHLRSTIELHFLISRTCTFHFAQCSADKSKFKRLFVLVCVDSWAIGSMEFEWKKTSTNISFLHNNPIELRRWRKVLSDETIFVCTLTARTRTQPHLHAHQFVHHSLVLNNSFLLQENRNKTEKILNLPQVRTATTCKIIHLIQVVVRNRPRASGKKREISLSVCACGQKKEWSKTKEIDAQKRRNGKQIMVKPCIIQIMWATYADAHFVSFLSGSFHSIPLEFGPFSIIRHFTFQILLNVIPLQLTTYVFLSFIICNLLLFSGLVQLLIHANTAQA